MSCNAYTEVIPVLLQKISGTSVHVSIQISLQGI